VNRPPFPYCYHHRNPCSDFFRNSFAICAKFADASTICALSARRNWVSAGEPHTNIQNSFACTYCRSKSRAYRLSTKEHSAFHPMSSPDLQDPETFEQFGLHRQKRILRLDPMHHQRDYFCWLLLLLPIAPFSLQ